MNPKSSEKNGLPLPPTNTFDSKQQIHPSFFYVSILPVPTRVQQRVQTVCESIMKINLDSEGTRLAVVELRIVIENSTEIPPPSPLTQNGEDPFPSSFGHSTTNSFPRRMKTYSPLMLVKHQSQPKHPPSFHITQSKLKLYQAPAQADSFNSTHTKDFFLLSKPKHKIVSSQQHPKKKIKVPPYPHAPAQ